MKNDTPESRTMENIDQYGNIWKFSMTKTRDTGNRYKLSMFFNTKEYVITKFLTKSAATDSWELLEATNKKNRINENG